MYGYGPPPWGYPVPPPTPYTSLPPGYLDPRTQDPIGQAKRWLKFMEKEEAKRKTKAGQHPGGKPPKGRVFSYIEVFMLCTIISLPAGMLVSFLAVLSLKAWVGAMSSILLK